MYVAGVTFTKKEAQMRFSWEGVGGDQESRQSYRGRMWEHCDDYPRENAGPITDAVCLVDGCSSQGSHSEKIRNYSGNRSDGMIGFP